MQTRRQEKSAVCERSHLVAARECTRASLKGLGVVEEACVKMGNAGRFAWGLQLWIVVASLGLDGATGQKCSASDIMFPEQQCTLPVRERAFRLPLKWTEIDPKNLEIHLGLNTLQRRRLPSRGRRMIAQSKLACGCARFTRVADLLASVSCVLFVSVPWA